MKNLPKIIYVLLVAAALYACNKKDDREAMNIHRSEQIDTLFHHDTIHNGNDPIDTTYHGNDPYDTIYNGDPIDTIYHQNPYDTIWGYPTDTIYHGGNGHGGIDSSLIWGDSLSR